MPSRKADTLIRMLDDEEHRWRAIEKLEVLSSLDGQAITAVTKLWEIVWSRNKQAPAPLNQRISALRAIGAINKTNSGLARDLFELITNPQTDYSLRVEAALQLGKLGKSARNVEEDLRKYINDTWLEDELNRALTKALKNIHGNPERLFKEILETLKSLDTHCWVEVSILSELELSERNLKLAKAALWDYLHKVTDEASELVIIPYIFQCILDLHENDEIAFGTLWKDPAILAFNKMEIVSRWSFLSNLVDNFKNGSARAEIINTIVMALQSDQEWIRNGALTLLLKLQSEKLLSKKDSELLNTAVQNCLDTYNQGLALVFLCKLDEQEGRSWLEHHPDAQSAIGLFFFWDKFGESLLNDRWHENQQVALTYVLQALNDRDDPTIVLEWLKNRIAGVETESLCEKIKKDLLTLESSGEFTDINVLNKIRDALDLVDQRLKFLRPGNLLKAIRVANTGDEDSLTIEKIQLLVKSSSAVELRRLIGVWLGWVAESKNQALIEATASLLRDCDLTVVPLVDHLNEVANAVTQMREMKNEGIDKQNKHLEYKRQAYQKKLQAKYRIIARQIAAMSDQRLFADKDTYARIKHSLQDYAVPVIVKWLRTETDIEVRESMASALGNIALGDAGGRDAINALVHAVADEEKKRQARQNLLADYYLEPAKRYGDQAADILQSAVADAKNTLRTLHRLNIALFVIGALVLIVGFGVSLFGQDNTRFFGAIAGLGGLLGLLYHLIYKPLAQIQEAMADLVQLETAFTSFVWELNLNSTYIQSQYVANGTLEDADIAKTLSRIESSMSLAMRLVAVHIDKERQRFITRLSPTTGELGSTVTIFGQHLRSDAAGKKDQTSIIAINHIPVQVERISWKEGSIKFNLPRKLPGSENQDGTIWISLLFDGMETNALPFDVSTPPKQ